MEHPGPIVPASTNRVDSPSWPVWLVVAFMPLAGAIALAWAGFVDAFAVLVAALIVTPLTELLDNDARWVRFAVGEAFPASATPPKDDSLELLAMSIPWMAGVSGCPWPMALPPGRHLTAHAKGRRDTQ